MDDNGGEGAIVTFAHLKGFKAQKLHDYRAALEATGEVDIRWHVFGRHPFRVDSPSAVELLQLADTSASALFRAVEPDAFGNTEPRYLEELRTKLYRREPGQVTSYGLKVFPVSVVQEGGSLAFLRDF